MTLEKELNKVLENISLIQTSQSELKFPVDDLGDFSDYLSDYIPNHVDWIKKGNEKLANSIIPVSYTHLVLRAIHYPDVYCSLCDSDLPNGKFQRISIIKGGSF